MKWTFAIHVVVVAFIFAFAPLAVAQEDETYDFDGVADMDPQPEEPTDWMTSENWSDGGADPFPPFGPEIPDFGTSVEIETSEFGVNAPVIGPGDEAEAFDVRIGRFGGEGLLTMTGGTLTTVDSCSESPFTCNRRLRVGAAQVALPADRHPGTFNLSGGVVTTDNLWIGSGSQGNMTMSGGELNTRADFSLDWTFDAGSNFTMTNGTVNVGTDLRMHRNTLLTLNGGEIFVGNHARLGTEIDSGENSQGGPQTPNVTVSITDGLMDATGYLQVGGSITLDGGILRANRFEESISAGTIEINGSGILQFDNSQESVADVESHISSGFFTTSEGSPLIVDVVDLDGTDFTQVSLGAVCGTGDFDCDGDTDGNDFLAWQRGFGDEFDATDLADWESGFGTVPLSATVQAVPEPSFLSLMALCGIVLLGIKRPCSTAEFTLSRS